MPELTIPGATPEMIREARSDGGKLDLDKLRQLAEGTYQESPFDSTEIASLGVSGQLGDTVLMPSMARIMLLSMFDSPYLSDSEEAVMPDVIETAKTAYILTHGPSCLLPLLQSAQFEERLPIFERIGLESTEHMAAVEDCIHRLCQTLARFEVTALEWFEDATEGMAYTDVVSIVNDSIQRTIEAYHRIPDETDL